MKRMDVDKVLKSIKGKFPTFTDDDSVRRAVETSEYVWMFPEDMVESRNSWDKLKDMLDRMYYGFNALLDLFAGEDCE